MKSASGSGRRDCAMPRIGRGAKYGRRRRQVFGSQAERIACGFTTLSNALRAFGITIRRKARTRYARARRRCVSGMNHDAATFPEAGPSAARKTNSPALAPIVVSP
jgi:hypothetical protein